MPTAYVKAGDVVGWLDEENGVWGTDQTACKFDPDGSSFESVSVSSVSVGGAEVEAVTLYHLPIPLGLTEATAGSGTSPAFPPAPSPVY